jgi:hypothetical protein
MNYSLNPTRKDSKTSSSNSEMDAMGMGSMKDIIAMMKKQGKIGDERGDFISEYAFKSPQLI